jgi:hypothetical protein
VTSLEDDELDDEEYRRMIDRRKRAFIGFSNLRDGAVKLSSVERRMTLFNPLDPNNATQALRFIKMSPQRIRQFSRKERGVKGEISEKEDAEQSMLSDVDETNKDELSALIVEEP